MRCHSLLVGLLTVRNPALPVLGTGLFVVSPELAQETPLPQISRVGLQLRWRTQHFCQGLG